MSAWVALDAWIADDERIVALATDAQRWAYIVALTRAKLQKEPGGWPNERTLRHDLGLLLRHLPALVDAGLIGTDGARYWIADWDSLQRDPTHARRQAEYRARQKAEESEPLAHPIVPKLPPEFDDAPFDDEGR